MSLSQIETGIQLPAMSDVGRLGIMQLKRYWFKTMQKRARIVSSHFLHEEMNIDQALFSALGLPLQDTLMWLYSTGPSFEEFENWIAENGGIVATDRIAAFNASVAAASATGSTDVPQVLTADELSFWEEHGYLVIKGAVPKEDCDATIALMCERLGISRYDPATWYGGDESMKQGIMVQLFHHPLLQQNRDNKRIRSVYEQLLNTTDIWVTMDRVGINPPETSTHKFPGPRLHWDVSLELPIPFGLQGILYLADTAHNQGAFTLVPGFHNRIESWINSLPQGADPRRQDLYALDHKPIAAAAGDFIIWHQALPHGSSPNTAALPRFVQYINYVRTDMEIKKKWL